MLTSECGLRISERRLSDGSVLYQVIASDGGGTVVLTESESFSEACWTRGALAEIMGAAADAPHGRAIGGCPTCGGRGVWRAPYSSAIGPCPDCASAHSAVNTANTAASGGGSPNSVAATAFAVRNLS